MAARRDDIARDRRIAVPCVRLPVRVLAALLLFIIPLVGCRIRRERAADERRANPAVPVAPARSAKVGHGAPVSMATEQGPTPKPTPRDPGPVVAPKGVVVLAVLGPAQYEPVALAVALSAVRGATQGLVADNDALASLARGMVHFERSPGVPVTMGAAPRAGSADPQCDALVLGPSGALGGVVAVTALESPVELAVAIARRGGGLVVSDGATRLAGTLGMAQYPWAPVVSPGSSEAFAEPPLQLGESWWDGPLTSPRLGAAGSHGLEPPRAQSTPRAAPGAGGARDVGAGRVGASPTTAASTEQRDGAEPEAAAATAASVNAVADAVHATGSDGADSPASGDEEGQEHFRQSGDEPAPGQAAATQDPSADLAPKQSISGTVSPEAAVTAGLLVRDVEGHFFGAAESCGGSSMSAGQLTPVAFPGSALHVGDEGAVFIALRGQQRLEPGLAERIYRHLAMVQLPQLAADWGLQVVAGDATVAVISRHGAAVASRPSSAWAMNQPGGERSAADRAPQRWEPRTAVHEEQPNPAENPDAASRAQRPDAGQLHGGAPASTATTRPPDAQQSAPAVRVRDGAGSGSMDSPRSTQGDAGVSSPNRPRAPAADSGGAR